MCGKCEKCPILKRVLDNPTGIPGVGGITGYSFPAMLVAAGFDPQEVLRAAMETDFAAALRGDEPEDEGKVD
jgi:hypothetical protein